MKQFLDLYGLTMTVDAIRIGLTISPVCCKCIIAECVEGGFQPKHKNRIILSKMKI